MLKLQISGGLRMFKNQYVKNLEQIYKELGYENIPFSSKENAKWILQNMNTGFRVLAYKEYMKTMKIERHNVLRGHIILLWWLENPRTKKDTFPKYFERDYGIDAKAELKTLKKYRWINRDYLLTKKGKKILLEYDYIIKQHRAIKHINFDGTIEYNYSNILKGKEKEAERLKWNLRAFDEDIKHAEEKDMLLEWLTAEDDKVCSKCREFAERDNGYGKGIYNVRQAKKIRNEIHWDCRCAWIPYIQDDIDL